MHAGLCHPTVHSAVAAKPLHLSVLVPHSTCDLQAMALAHWSAVRTLVPSLAGGSGVPPGQLHNLSMSLAACIARGPTLLGLNPELHQLFNEMLSRVPQVCVLLLTAL